VRVHGLPATAQIRDGRIAKTFRLDYGGPQRVRPGARLPLGDEMSFFWRAGILVLASMAVGCDPETPYPTRLCRSHATQYLSSGEGITNGYPNIQPPIRVECQLDRDLLERTCTAQYLDQYARPSVHTQTVRYASLTDFVNEATPVGRVQAISVKVSDNGWSSGTIVAPYLHSSSSGETFYVYDLDGRLTNHRFDTWDGAGRPLTAPPTGICTWDTGTRMEYDDATRTVTLNYNTRTSTRPPDGSVPCIMGRLRWTFDANGNPTSYGATNYSMQEVEEVCVDVEG